MILLGKVTILQGYLYWMSTMSIMKMLDYLLFTRRHARLGYFSIPYIKKNVVIGMISNSGSTRINKCEGCTETKQTKKTCTPVHGDSELLSLIHADLSDLKQMMTRCGKKYYVTFIDNCSRYTKVYLEIRMKLLVYI